MRNHRAPSDPASRSVRAITALLAVGWGILFATLLFQALLIHFNLRLELAALLTLIVVWGTLERKRWGRLALLGFSCLTLCLSATLLPGDDLSDFPCLPSIPMALAACLWLCLPAVIREFEHGKNKRLASSQRVVALCMVVIWGLLIFPSQRHGSASGIPSHSPLELAQKVNNSLAMRSADSLNSR